MFTGYIIDNLGSPGIEETLPKFRRVKKKKKFASSTLYKGRLTDKLIEKLGLLHLGWQQGRNFDSHILSLHRWIRFLFVYVIMLNVTYILTGGIVNNTLCLRAVTGGTFLENHPSRQHCSSVVISSFHRSIGLDFGYVVCSDVA
jgi:hypothetical protein